MCEDLKVGDWSLGSMLSFNLIINLGHNKCHASKPLPLQLVFKAKIINAILVCYYYLGKRKKERFPINWSKSLSKSVNQFIYLYALSYFITPIIYFLNSLKPIFV